MTEIKEWLSKNIFRLLSFFLAGYFFFIFHRSVGFPPKWDLTTTTTTYLILSIFFLLLPYAKKIKIGDFMEFEAKVKEIKSEVKDFKEETRQIISLQNNLINTVSNTLNQNINITMPGPKEVEEAQKELSEIISEPEEFSASENRIGEFIESADSDINYALAKLRIELEQELRRILGKRSESKDISKMKGKFLTARSLFRMFISKYPKYEGMSNSFDYVLTICNAAIHGQKILEGYANDALYMGLRIIDELKKINSN